MKDDILLKELGTYGFKASITPTASVKKIQDELIGLNERGLIDKQLYDEYMQWMTHDYKEIMPEAKSVIIMAHPHAGTKLEFNYNDEKHIVLIPPTYVGSGLLKKAEDALIQILTPYHFSSKYANLPLKLVAARTGLSKYGRNNISYVEGMGSYHRLFAYYTDYQCQTEDWNEIAAMQECSNCKACMSVCPTGCINGERFLIHAENCITYFNEVDRAFPSWLQKDWHNAIIGCMKCQINCPANSEYNDRVESEFVFEQDETVAILAKTPLDKLPTGTRMKLEAVDMIEYYNVLERNLSALIK